MATVELRHYDIEPGRMDGFVEWWSQCVPLRERYGFRILFAFVDETTNQFVWAVAHDGDLVKADAEYHASPELAALFEIEPDGFVKANKATVKVIVSP
jgi:hypothetical protein